MSKCIDGTVSAPHGISLREVQISGDTRMIVLVNNGLDVNEVAAFFDYLLSIHPTPTEIVPPVCGLTLNNLEMRLHYVVLDPDAITIIISKFYDKAHTLKTTLSSCAEKPMSIHVVLRAEFDIVVLFEQDPFFRWNHSKPLSVTVGNSKQNPVRHPDIIRLLNSRVTRDEYRTSYTGYFNHTLSLMKNASNDCWLRLTPGSSLMLFPLQDLPLQVCCWCALVPSLFSDSVLWEEV